MRQLNWGILSTAAIARKAMIPAIQAAPNARLIAIASESGKAGDVAAEYDIPRPHDSFRHLLEDPDVEAVYVPLPNHLHARWVCEAARHGKAVLCEKPAALTAEEARTMQAACDQAGVALMEGYMYRHHPQHARARELLDNGEIGEVRQVRGLFSFPLDLAADNIRLSADQAGGSLHDVGCYPLDVIRRLLGMPEAVTVVGQVPAALGVDTSVGGLLRYGDGRLAEFGASFEQTMVNRYEVIGSHGSLLLPAAFRPDKQGGVGEVIVTDERGRVRRVAVYGDQYPAQIEAFSAWVLGERPAPDAAGELHDQARLVEACRRSLQEGFTVSL
jgi:D-xylose 1-dehydrogenase (NADP+, D-xylono-1,5-lactone-forming)